MYNLRKISRIEFLSSLSIANYFSCNNTKVRNFAFLGEICIKPQNIEVILCGLWAK